MDKQNHVLFMHFIVCILVTLLWTISSITFTGYKIKSSVAQIISSVVFKFCAWYCIDFVTKPSVQRFRPQIFCTADLQWRHPVVSHHLAKWYQLMNRNHSNSVKMLLADLIEEIWVFNEYQRAFICFQNTLQYICKSIITVVKGL